MSLIESPQSRARVRLKDKPLERLLPKHEALIEDIVFGKSIDDVSERYRLQTRSIRRILRSTPGSKLFAELLQQRRREKEPKAIGVVEKTMDWKPPDDIDTVSAARLRMDAACKILGDFAPKAAAVEAKIEGSTFIQIVQRITQFEGPVEPPAYLGEIDTPEKFRARQRGDSD